MHALHVSGDGAGGGAVAAAVAARGDALVAHLLLATESGLLEAHLEVALDVPLVAPADAEDAQQIAQDAVERDVADVDHAAGERPPGSERRSRLFDAVPEAVVHRPPLRVANTW